MVTWYHIRMVVKNEAQEDDHNTVINIVVTARTWKRLTALKEAGDSFNTVIKRLLEEKEAEQ